MALTDIDVRIELSALYRILHMFGMTDLANQCAGARSVENKNCSFVHPYGMFYEEITASSLVKIDEKGKKLNSEGPWLNDGCINLAQWIFNSRKDVNFYVHGHANDVRGVYLDYKKRKESFIYHFKSECGVIASDLSSRSLSFDDGFHVHNGQHPRMLRLLIQKKYSYQTAVVLNHFLGFTKNWDKEITEKIVWPEISLKVARVKPFINFNATECKLIMKEIFVNG